MTSPDADAWRGHLLEDDLAIASLLRQVRRIAVLGIKIARTAQPAFYVPQYLQRVGYEILPVPVYHPEVTEILGIPIVRRVAEVPPPVDLVNVFRRPPDIDAHLDDILSARPRAVWFQSGIRNDAAAERLARAGVDVVQDRCLMVEIQRLAIRR